MHHLADLLATISLPARSEEEASRPPARVAACPSTDAGLVHDLGADLPGGHLHVWGGPSGAGKTAFLLCLLHGAAVRGRRVLYATYDLPPESLALRLLAMTAGVDWRALPDPGGEAESDDLGSCSRESGALGSCSLSAGALERARAAYAALEHLPFSILPARGLTARSLWDRIVRMPFRAEVLAVDYLQGVVREPGTDMGVALRELSDLAEHLHVSVVCAVRAEHRGGERVPSEADEAVASGRRVADRVGWIAPSAGSGSRRAEVLHNRHGERPAVPLHLDEATGGLERAL